MSKESATAFAQAAIEDNELRERTAKLDPEELLPIARGMGYDFTAEELEEVMNGDRELAPDELDSVVGGMNNQRAGEFELRRHRRESDRNMAEHCYGKLSGPLHDWVVVGHEERWMFWAWTRGYDLLKCSRCGATKDRSV